jgi:uncharacterized Tic20 family protein
MVAGRIRAEHESVDIQTEMRCSDADREPVIDQLKQAYAEGRLDHEEFDLRIHLVMTAKTYRDLAIVTRDLVPAEQPRHSQAPDGEDRLLGALAHASGYFTSILGPLLFLLLSGKRSEYVRRHAAEALNFQLTVLLVVAVTFGLGAVLYLVTWIVAGIAAISALAGGSFRYPWTLRLIK